MGVENLILHVGSPKTGTTSLQTWLTDADEALLAHDVRYLRAFRRGPSHNYLMRLAVAGDHEDFLKRKINAELRHATQKTVLISTETTFSPPRTQLLVGLIDPDLCGNIEVLFYFRRQDLFLEALAKQKFKNGGLSGSMRNYIERKKFRGSYLTYIREVEKALPRVSVVCRPFDRRTLVGKNVISDFWDYLGLPQDARPEISGTKTNKTPSAELVEALGTHAFPSNFYRRRVINRLIATEPDLFGSRDILTNGERQNLMDAHRDENRVLSKLCGWDLEELFHDSVDFAAESRAVEDEGKRRALLTYAKRCVAEAAELVE